jgi:penicillin-binding protein 1C
MKTRGDIFSGIEFSNAYCDKDGKLLQVFLTNDDKYRIYRPIEEFPDDFIEALLLNDIKYMNKFMNDVALNTF